MKIKVSRIKPSSIAYILGILYAILGLIGGIVITIFSLFNPAESDVGAISIIFLPIIYGLCGLIGGFISAFLYNLIASWVGGIEFESK